MVVYRDSGEDGEGLDTQQYSGPPRVVYTGSGVPVWRFWLMVFLFLGFGITVGYYMGKKQGDNLCELEHMRIEREFDAKQDKAYEDVYGGDCSTRAECIDYLNGMQ